MAGSYLDYLQQYNKMIGGDRSKVISQEQQDQERALRVSMYATMPEAARADRRAMEMNAALSTPSFGWSEGQPYQSDLASKRVTDFYSDVDAEIAKRNAPQVQALPVQNWAGTTTQPQAQAQVPDTMATLGQTSPLSTLLPNTYQQPNQQTGTLADLYKDKQNGMQLKPWWQP